MKIDGNEKEKAARTAFKEGNVELSEQRWKEFTDELRQSIAAGEDHCSCTSAYDKHGNCVECVAAHRGRQGHLPACFRQMVKEKIYGLSEQPLRKFTSAELDLLMIICRKSRQNSTVCIVHTIHYR